MDENGGFLVKENQRKKAGKEYEGWGGGRKGHLWYTEW